MNDVTPNCVNGLKETILDTKWSTHGDHEGLIGWKLEIFHHRLGVNEIKKYGNSLFEIYQQYYSKKNVKRNTKNEGCKPNYNNKNTDDDDPSGNDNNSNGNGNTNTNKNGNTKSTNKNRNTKSTNKNGNTNSTNKNGYKNQNKKTDNSSKLNINSTNSIENVKSK